MTPVKTILPAVLLALLLTGCTAAPAAEGPSPAEETEPSPSAAESQVSGPEASSEEDLAEDEPLDPEVEAIAYQLDVQLILDSLTEDLEGYRLLDTGDESFPERSVSIMRTMGASFQAIADLDTPDGYREIPALAGEAAGIMDQVAAGVEEAFALGPGTGEGAAALREAQQQMAGAVDRLSRITEILAEPLSDHLPESEAAGG